LRNPVTKVEMGIVSSIFSVLYIYLNSNNSKVLGDKNQESWPLNLYIENVQVVINYLIMWAYREWFRYSFSQILISRAYSIYNTLVYNTM